MLCRCAGRSLCEYSYSAQPHGSEWESWTTYVYLSSTEPDTINLNKLPEEVVRGLLFLSSEAVM